MIKKRQVLIVGNWKMFPKTIDEARSIIRMMERVLKNTKKIAMVVCPPALFVADIARHAHKKKSVSIGVQNMHQEVEGAHTGDISARQSMSVGAKYVIIGHAERRAIGETDIAVQQKTFLAVTTGLTPIVCVGEKERDAQGAYLDFVNSQITSAMALVPQHMRSRIIFAYEPLYAIGAPKPPAEHDIHQMILSIRKMLHAAHGPSIGRTVRVLYGGAVDTSNAQKLFEAIPELSGFLIGRASVDPEKCEPLLRSFLA